MGNGFAGLRAARSAAPIVVLIVLLATAKGASETDLVAALQGTSWFQNATSPGQTFGYYEPLIESSRDPQTRTVPPQLSTNPLPPGVVLFAAAGIVDESLTYLRWRLKPNLDVRWNGTIFRTNRDGYRTPDVEIPKRDGVYRIVVFGSSSTMGHAVNNDDAYPRHLERWLNDQFGGQRRIEVVNLAVSGDSPTRRLERIRQEGQRFAGDWWLCDATALDYFLEEAHLRAVVTKAIPVPFPFVRDALARSGVSPGDDLATFQQKLRGEFEGLLDGAYAGWSAEAKRIGVPITVVILPRSDHQARSTRIYRLMGELAARHGLDTIDVSQAFHGLDEQRLHAAAWDKHPSPLGQFAIFEALRNELLRRGGIPGLAFAKPE